MYRVMVVDDEPAALNHICTVIEKKCPDFTVTMTAENGRDALAKIRQEPPDVLISDVKMPVMGGIQLVFLAREEYPDIISLIVSGYDDFEYAKGAIRSGVCDYLLKPLKPAALQERMEEVRQMLDLQYYEKRKKLLREVCGSAKPLDRKEMARYFPEGGYCAALIRQNGLPRRFAGYRGIEIFSMQEEQVFLYGRDEMEALYLVPEALLLGKTFEQVTEHYYTKMQNEYNYVTAVIYPDVFPVTCLPEVMRHLYRKLDESIIIGYNQFLTLDSSPRRKLPVQDDNIEMEHIEYLVKYKETGKLILEVEELFEEWEKKHKNQLFVENQVLHLCYLIESAFQQPDADASFRFTIDEAFYYASSMHELRDSITAMIAQALPENACTVTDDKEHLFDSILSYLEHHISETLTLNRVCRHFGISQTALSKMFRKYKSCSFNNYITNLRIEKAKQIMMHHKNAYIKDIAEKVGYSDQFYFSRIFRSVVGVCPSDYLETSHE